MAYEPSSSSSSPISDKSNTSTAPDFGPGDSIGLQEVFARLRRGLSSIIGLGILGFAIAATMFLVVDPITSSTTTMRVTFGFTGYSKGEYPDHSKFDPDDLRAPDVVLQALKQRGLDVSEDFQSKVRAALTIEGVIPPNLIKERDRLRAAGQTLAPFIPDEYLVTLTLPHKFSLGSRERELLLSEIVSVFQEKFKRTYAELPIAFGGAFESLHNADFFEYEIILNQNVQKIVAYLEQQKEQAKMFRSPTTNLSFGDLLSQTQDFAQIRLSELLGLIREKGLSTDRKMAMVKMNYYLRVLEDQESKASEEEMDFDG